MKKLYDDNYFQVKLKGSNGIMSIHEKRNLSPQEYHLVDGFDVSRYQILTEVVDRVGKEFYCLGVFPEEYKTYKFQNVTFPIINNFDIDGFWYDSDNGIVLYGWIYYIYAVKDGRRFYDVVTGEEIPLAIIDSTFEVEVKKDYLNMIEDLELISLHKEAYIKIMDERFSMLIQGAINEQSASQRYSQNYDTRKKSYDDEMSQRVVHLRNNKDKCSSQREEVKKLLHKIRNSV